MIVNITGNLKRKSFVVPIALCELVLAFLLVFYPDWAKVFLFGLPLVLLFGEAIELLYNFFRKNAAVFSLLAGIVLALAGGGLIFCGRKTYMVGIAVLMFFEVIRFFVFAQKKDVKTMEKLICIGAALLSLIWLLLILFKGLHLYWSVREYLAMYFAGSAFISLLRKR